ncbi:MAG: hypothetical protein AAFX05_14885 [Planctomycetota bacterium]
MAEPVVVLVGHCGFDAGSLEKAVRTAIPEARIERADDAAALQALEGDAHLLLINRVLERGFATSEGIDLIRALAANGPAAMLISNYADAQQEAEQAGALPGFGKSDIQSEETLDLLRRSMIERRH